ncbi:MAG: tetratricopeptide repeat protein, partial [Anaerolineales bacterium]|nr:tetratricopeptide repeat protein [Anaerolineales bacterium]
MFLAVVFAGCSTKEERAAKHLERANRYYESDKLEEAEIEYKNVLRFVPTNGVAISRLGIIYHAQGKLLPAIALLVKAKEIRPDDLEARNKLAWSLQGGNRVKEAREEVLLILGKQPGHEEALILLGETVQSSNDLAEVKGHLERLRPQAENQAGYQLAWSSLYYRQGQVAEAEAALRKALLLDPKSSAVHATLGNFYLAQDNLAEADRFLKAAADLAPPRSGRRLRYAEFKIRHNDPAGGKEMLIQMTEETPDYLPAWSRLAELA